MNAEHLRLYKTLWTKSCGCSVRDDLGTDYTETQGGLGNDGGSRSLIPFPPEEATKLFIQVSDVHRRELGPHTPPIIGVIEVPIPDR